MNKVPLIISLLGKSGSGKGTQVGLLKEKLGLAVVGTGDMLRERRKVEDFTGKKISQVIDNGGIIPSPVVFKLCMDVFEDMKNEGNFKGMILDGAPRKLKEAMLLDETFEWFEWGGNIKILLIDISDEEAINRITKRKICSKCGNILIYTNESPDEDKCSKCGGELIKRPDDTVEKTEKRLGWFKTEVEPVINYYKEKGWLITINGEQTIEDVFKDVLKAIGE